MGDHIDEPNTPGVSYVWFEASLFNSKATYLQKMKKKTLLLEIPMVFPVFLDFPL